jgi:hypothetical protein
MDYGVLLYLHQSPQSSKAPTLHVCRLAYILDWEIPLPLKMDTKNATTVMTRMNWKLIGSPTQP